MTFAAKTAPKQRGAHTRGRPFQRGCSGNPSGKPRGTRNRATILLETITHGDLDAIIATIVDKAKAGDLVAAKLILDRVAPPPKSRTVSVELSPIGQWDGGDTALQSYRTIIEAVASSQISPAEGLELTSLIEAHRAVVKELRPEAMHREPTAKELAQQKQQMVEATAAWERISLKL